MITKSKLIANRVIGRGSGCVYVYYFENDKALALSEGLERWECKIGYTKKSLSKRLFEQGVSTSIPRIPVIAIEMRTNAPRIMETRIHRALAKRKITDSLGNEWYSTNPSEVEKIYKKLCPSIEKLEMAIGAFVDIATAFEVDSPDSLGFVLRKIRVDKKDSQGSIGAKVGMRQGTISNIENGSGGTRVATIFELLHTYGYKLIIAKNHDC
jgi:HTH-type transcriptional regulator / antitoxin HipB